MISLKIIEPTKTSIDDQFEHVIVPGVDGDLGIYEGHTPFITKIRPGVLTLYTGKKDEIIKYAIHDGFVMVDEKSIKIISECVESKEEIDAERAENAKMRAEKRIASPTPELDYKRAELALKRAVARLKVIHE